MAEAYEVEFYECLICKLGYSIITSIRIANLDHCDIKGSKGRELLLLSFELILAVSIPEIILFD
jgi:hypothetical protein